MFIFVKLFDFKRNFNLLIKIHDIYIYIYIYKSMILLK